MPKIQSQENMTAQEVLKSVQAGNITATTRESNLKQSVINTISTQLLDKQLDVAEIDTQIASLRQNDFESMMSYMDSEGEERILYIKDHAKNPEAEKDPVHSETAQLQALQYLKGLMLIANNCDKATVPTLSIMLNEISFAFAAYNDKNNPTNTTNTVEIDAQNTRDLADKFADIISKHLQVNLKKAHKQVTMARDIGILLTYPPAVCTITKQENGETVAELAMPIKIGQEKAEDDKTYYERNFSTDQPWFKDATKAAGLNTNTSNNWMANIFNKPKEYNFAQYGVAAPPSARWLPTPSGSQLIDNYIEKRNAAGIVTEQVDHQFVRMGITSSFEIKSEKDQKRFAKEQLKEIIRIQLKQSIENYDRKYDALLPKNAEPRNFFVSYQTLLSPFLGEAQVFTIAGKPIHRDNNGKFVEEAKKAIKEIAAEYADQKSASGNTYKLQFTHTNSAINKLADKWFSPLMRTFKASDTADLNLKFAAVADMMEAAVNKKPGAPTNLTLREIAKFIRSGGEKPKGGLDSALSSLETYVKGNSNDPSLATEMAMRIRAAYYLRDCLNQKSPYDEIPAHQRNLIKASLEALMLGSQALHLKGCKSARDRTAVAAGALRTMLLDPQTMSDPKKLMEGVKRSLEEGHHFRAMLYHNPIVKVGDVHKAIKALLSTELQSKIDALLVFGKKLKMQKEPKQATSKVAGLAQQQDATEEKRAKKPKLRTRFKAMVENGFERSKTLGRNLGRNQIERIKRVKALITNPQVRGRLFVATLSFFGRQIKSSPVLTKIGEKLQKQVKNKM